MRWPLQLVSGAVGIEPFAEVYHDVVRCNEPFSVVLGDDTQKHANRAALGQIADLLIAFNSLGGRHEPKCLIEDELGYE
jgi:hypothetical protein